MRLSSMRYKNYTWPHNPETFVVEYRRQMAAHKVPLGGCVLQDLGVNCRIPVSYTHLTLPTIA